MKDDFASAMRRATEATRVGNLQEATQMIQDALGRGSGGGMPAFSPTFKPTFKPRVAKGRAAPKRGGLTRLTFDCASGSRDYTLHLPQGGQPPVGLVVMLHGCTQSPEDFAAGTGMNALADAQGLAVLYPAQARGANMQSCWNWFSPADQRRGAGEPAILAGMAGSVATAHRIPADQVFVAGLSAGGAMAVVLGETYPEVFAAVGVHSGLPYGVANDVTSAFAAMGGAGGQASQGRETRTIVFHGQADKTVHPANGAGIAAAVPVPSGASHVEEAIAHGSRSARRRVTLRADGTPLIETWEIAGLGHAWSGGSSAGSYTDPQGPDASAAMLRFFRVGEAVT